MKRFKVVLFVAGGLALGVLLVVGLAFTSGFQTWAARRALAGQPGVAITVGSVSAGLSSAIVRDVRVEHAGTVIVVREVNAAFSATDYVFGRRINVPRLALRGVEVDARKAAAAKAAPAPAAAVAPFAGVLNAITLPGEVRVGE
ncbi:MAG: hypothetical protein RLZZ15_4448, partial [Verrucomicrobiota bacterium]